jgi:Ca2+-binding RTX toxin-like protein
MPKRRPRRAPVAIFAAVALAALIGPAAASASFDARIDGPRVIFNGTPGADNLTVYQAWTGYLVHNQTGPGYASTLDFDTSQPGDQYVVGVPGKDLEVVVNGGDGNDTIDVETYTGFAMLAGGGGNDLLTGGAKEDTLWGGDGDDRLTGNGGDDQDYGDAGRDTMNWKAGDDADRLVGGADQDIASLAGSDDRDVLTLAQDPKGIAVSGSTLASPLRSDAEGIRINAADGDDAIQAGSVPAPYALDLRGGDGDDILVGGQGPDSVRGDAGKDSLYGSGGADSLSGEVANGGEGNDRITVVPGANQWAIGGTGVDIAGLLLTSGADSLAARPDSADGDPIVVLDGLAGGVPFKLSVADVEATTAALRAGDDSATVAPGTGQLTALTIIGGDGDDTLKGSDGAEMLSGDGGRDSLDGGLGPDRLLGGEGDDAIEARDGGQDQIACDAGLDSLHADLGDADAIADGCEQVERAAPTPARQALAGVAAPGTFTSNAQHRVSVPVTCSAGARGGCHGTLTLTSANPVDILGVDMLVGSAPFDIAPGATAPVEVSLAGGVGLVPIVSASGGALPVQAEVLTGGAARTTPITVMYPVR